MNEETLEEIDSLLTIDLSGSEVDVPDMNRPPDMLELIADGDFGPEVHHVNNEHQAGFDLTDFGNPEPFAKMLDSLGLNSYWNYYRVETSPGNYLFVWANDEGMILTGNNPITGDYRRTQERLNEEGYASYIGIEGTESFVKEAINHIIEYSTNYKELDRNRRGFI